MLQIKPFCENCQKPLPNGSLEAMICSFECTFCKNCVDEVLQNVCPNCGGGFEKRPIRPFSEAEKYPPLKGLIYKEIDRTQHQMFLEKYKDTPPHMR